MDPNYATAHHWYAEHLMWQGRFDEALLESERARQLDPLSLIIAADNGVILYFSRQYDRAIEKFRSVQEMDPNFPRANMILYAYVEKKMFAEALAVAEDGKKKDGEGAWYWSLVAYIHGRAGQLDEARRAVRKLENWEKVHPKAYLDPSILVLAYIGVGDRDRDRVFAQMEEAYQRRSNVVTTLKVEPAFDSLRSDPRFVSPLDRVHLSKRSAVSPEN